MSWRDRRYWRVRQLRQGRYRFSPYASTKLVRFFIQRPSGYTSVYSWSSALRDGRTSRRLDGCRDPIYVSLNGAVPVRLPFLRGPIRPRKSPLRYGTPAEQDRPD